MTAEIGSVRFGSVGEQPLSRPLHRVRKLAKHRDQIRLINFDLRVKNVASKQSFLAVGSQANGSVVNTVPRGWMEEDAVQHLTPSTLMSLASPASRIGAMLSA